MILDRFPAVRGLPNSEKSQLVLELLEDLRDSEEEVTDPVLLEILHQRRARFEADSASARRWEDVRDQILRRAAR